MNTIVKQ